MNHESSLQNIIFNLLTDSRYSFYGLFIAEINKTFSNFPTACIGKHPNSQSINMFIGKDFWEKTCKNDSMRAGILIHELEHMIREHISETSSLIYQDRMLANIAMDVSINQCIYEELPRVDEKGEKIGVFIEDFPELRKNESSLYYYTELVKMKEKKEQSKGKCDSLAGPKGNNKGSSGNETLDGYLDARDEGKMGDWHEKWKELTEGMSEKEKELFKQELQDQLRRVAEETEKIRGTVPAHLRDTIAKNFERSEPVVNWKTLFNRFVGSTITSDIYQTRKRPNFRFEDAPSNKYKSKIKIVVGMDSSGSVSDSDLEEFFAQTKHMYNAGVKITICIWDAKVHKTYEYKGENIYERVCQGGTYASSFIEYVNEHKQKEGWTCAINLTDGYIENEPIPCKIPLLWVITRDGSDEFKHRGKKIKIN